MEIILVIFVLIAASIAISRYLTKKKRERLMLKYGDAEVVDKIMRNVIWQGMSEAQLIDSWGIPAAKDQKIYKTKVTETFKYVASGKNRFRNRVRVENGVVVGWEKK